MRLRNKSNEVGLPGRLREATWTVKGVGLRGGGFLTSDQGSVGISLHGSGSIPGPGTHQCSETFLDNVFNLSSIVICRTGMNNGP